MTRTRERARAYRAPGRVNLMGDHTDYHDGLVLPMAIDRSVTVTAAGVLDAAVRVTSEGFAGVVEVKADGSTDPATVEVSWGRLVAAVVQVLAERGRPPVGADLEVSSTVPPGAGLSSSAAFAVATAVALLDVAQTDLDPVEVALACQEAEQLATGVPCGVMDQLASVAGLAGHALLLDCRSLAVTPIPMPADLAVVVVDSKVPRTLEETPYAARRAESEADAHDLGLASLRDASPDQVADRPRARHVVSESARVEATADALRRGDRAALGRLFADSHASLRDDYEVSTPEVDSLVEGLVAAGVVSARLTGAGFGGRVVALVDAGDADRVVDQFEDHDAFVVKAADGAGRVEP